MPDDDAIVGEGAVVQAGGPTTNIRLYLRATSLPKSIVTQQQPDVLARVSLLAPRDGSHPPPPPANVDDDDDGDGGGGGGGGNVALEGTMDETEVVRKCSNPRWTTTFAARYEYGTQLLFFVDLFVVVGGGPAAAAGNPNVVGNAVRSRGMRLIGRAAFDVQDVLGSSNKVMARRLPRNAGICYAHIEIERQPQTPPSSPGRRRLLSSSSATTSSASPDGRTLNLRLRADSLVHTHSRLRNVTSSSRPDTYLEISRRLSTGQWIAVYRSPPVSESVTPTWDEASIDVGPSSTDLGDFHVMISVYKVKRTKCKEIGSFETTVQSLIDSRGATSARLAGDSRRPLHGNEDAGNAEVRDNTFQLLIQRPAANGSEVTGIITVVNASVENVNDARGRSQRFLSSSDEVERNHDGGDGDSVSDMFGVDASRIAPRGPPSSRHARPRFVDYVRAGMVNVDFCVAVDFTSSNGDPRVPGTLHYSICALCVINWILCAEASIKPRLDSNIANYYLFKRDGMMNDYEEAIAAFGSTIEMYSKNQEYRVWGFGAKYDGEIRHIFQCGGGRHVRGTQGALDAYRSVFETDLTMSGPTIISEVLRAAAGRSQRFLTQTNTDMHYCILLILTDGIVHNLRDTQQLVRSYRDRNLPLSVIVVGIGRADFTEFHQWDQSPPELRGRFKFVEFREHQIDPDNLPRNALMNVPHEVVDYYMARNIFPNEG
ncbi:LOW QUALITY PROTEIN: hypothetical protein ACHAW5_010337 [Stephanodiscus triporus]|uniref:C2 domain-containing protein n=1 Tax=Stephanodiscus triporus TaxID=2934178 RepID=A0ABD3NP50_9STRA